MAYKSVDGKLVQEGCYLDTSGNVLHIRLRNNGFEYSDDFESYTTLTDKVAPALLLGKIEDPKKTQKMLEKMLGKTPPVVVVHNHTPQYMGRNDFVKNPAD